MMWISLQLKAAARKMAERLRLEETLQALEAAVGGKWDEGQELDLSSDVSGSLENMALDPNNAPPPINRSSSFLLPIISMQILII